MAELEHPDCGSATQSHFDAQPWAIIRKQQLCAVKGGNGGYEGKSQAGTLRVTAVIETVKPLQDLITLCGWNAGTIVRYGNHNSALRAAH